MSRLAQRGSAASAVAPSDKIEDPGGELHANFSTLNIHARTPKFSCAHATSLPQDKSMTTYADAEATAAAEEECPVCHSKRYLRRNMRFLVNPECYHKMCESCVDRIFSHGPAPCPIPGCKRTLRRNKFRTPTFDDLRLEREVDIRRRVAQIFNRREDEFETIKDYNDYLNEVEDLTFNLIYQIDIEATENKLKQYKEENDAAILENLRLEAETARDAQARQAAEQQAARLRREASLREDEEQRREREEARQDILNKLASGDGDAETIAREGQRTILRKARNRQALLDVPRLDDSWPSGAESGNSLLKGLKRRTQHNAEPAKPFDPFGGMTETREYYVLQDDYVYDFLKDAKTKPEYLAGGYDVREYYARALCEAFAGLGVIVADEKAETDTANAKIPPEAAAAGVASGTPEVAMADVFG